MKKADGPNVGNTLSDFIHEFGAPEDLTFDGADAQKDNKTLFYKKNLRRAEKKWRISAPRRPNENPGEGAIQELKGRWYRLYNQNTIFLVDYGIIV